MTHGQLRVPRPSIAVGSLAAGGLLALAAGAPSAARPSLAALCALLPFLLALLTGVAKTTTA
jgi:hypothetical protein